MFYRFLDNVKCRRQGTHGTLTSPAHTDMEILSPYRVLYENVLLAKFFDKFCVSLKIH